MEVKPLEEVQYHSSDFAWDEHARASAAALEAQAAASDAHWAALPGGRDGVEELAAAARQASSWESFHGTLHSSARVYKERRYLLKEFEELQCPGIRVLEMGCGNGSSALAVLRDNPTAEVWACDFSPAAVEHVKDTAEHGGYAGRCTSFVWDPATEAEPAAAAGLAEGCIDVVLLVFTLSAVPPSRMGHLLAAASRLLAPGGRIFLRDYGSLDLAMLRFPPAQRLGEHLYMRSDGTLSYFFTAEAARGALEGAGFDTEEAEYHTVSLKNRRNNKEMRRVFLHGKFRKPH